MEYFSESLLNLSTAATLFCGGTASIAISVWLSKNDSGGNADNWNEICTSYPNEYLRPFQISITGANDPSYCGYPETNTILRLVVACLSVLCSFGYIFRVTDENPQMFRAILFVFILIWTTTVIVDSTTLGNAIAACEDFSGDYDDISCDSDSYGIMIAVTGGVSVILTVLWTLQRSIAQWTKSEPLLSPTETTPNPNFASNYYLHQSNNSPTSNTPTPMVHPSGDSRDPNSSFFA